MNVKFRVWFQENYYRLINSIAFYPAIIALMFLIASALSIAFDFSEEGKEIKMRLHWLRLKDPSTARSIIASVAAGIISLTVFSFSMVMIVLNQTASQMSNRILDKLIGSRFQQIVLGIYVGTIVYALFLLSTIRDIESGIHIPALSTYILIGITICDIFLFIYFLHYITQSVKYDVIIKRILHDTTATMKSSLSPSHRENSEIPFIPKSVIVTPRTGIYSGFSSRMLLELCNKKKCTILIIHAPGAFLIEGIPLANVDRDLSQAEKEQFQEALYLHQSESVGENFRYGFQQLTEVAIKALSPGINDPGTAIQAMHALFELYSYRISHAENIYIRSQEKLVRVIKKELSFDEIFESTLLPIWDYGKSDRMVCKELSHLLQQMMLLSPRPVVAKLLKEVDLAIPNSPSTSQF